MPDAHHCPNCEGIDPATCLTNPDRTGVLRQDLAGPYGEAPTDGARVVAYRSPGTRALYCVVCARQEAGWRPVTAADVPDAAVCDFCGGRVLDVASRTLGDVVARYVTEGDPTPKSTPCSDPPCSEGGTGEPCDRHETEQAHADGEHEYCGITCEIQMPTALMANAIVATGYPGTAGMLDELLRRAAAGQIPPAEDRQPGPDVVAYRNPDQPTALWCRKHGARWWGLTPLASEDLPDGGVCGECGVDVLIPQEPQP